jgi:hypothetical protein
LAAPVWADFMRRALRTVPNETLPIPEGILPARVNYRTGLPTNAGDPDGITEYFIRGDVERADWRALGGVLPFRVTEPIPMPPGPSHQFPIPPPKGGSDR